MLQNNANIQKENLIKNWNYTYESSIFAKIKSIFLRLVKLYAYPGSVEKRWGNFLN